MKPDLFEFYLGSFRGTSCYAKWTGTSLRFERTGGGNFTGSVSELFPSGGAWQRFRRDLEENGCFSWSEEYLAPHGCCGTTFWFLRIVIDGKHVETRGTGCFPPDGDPDPSAEFRAFLTAFSRLVAGS